MKREKYQYATLRYMHDVATREFLSVGVAVYVRQTGALEFKFRKSLGLAGKMFNSAVLADFRALMRAVSSQAVKVQTEYTESVLQQEPQKLEEILGAFFPADDSALQWSTVGSGLTAVDATAVVERLYKRYCGKYDYQERAERITDRDAWARFKKELQVRRIDRFFEPKTIHGAVDEVKFQFAWQNSVWHCLEPVSFDLGDADTIRDKAYRLVGEAASLRQATESFRVYYIATPPADARLQKAFNKAKQLLLQAPLGHDVQVETQGNEAALLDQLATKIWEHVGQDDASMLADADRG